LASQKNDLVGNMAPLKRALDIDGINLIASENQHLSFDKFYYWLTCARSLLKNI
jgi:hypothetical protein